VEERLIREDAAVLFLCGGRQSFGTVTTKHSPPALRWQELPVSEKWIY